MGTTGEYYEIRVGGSIGPDWSDWFGDMEIRSAMNGETIITGRVRDQAALHGLFARIAGLNLKLISVNPVTGHDLSNRDFRDEKGDTT